jgi:hypothetical protein
MTLKKLMDEGYALRAWALIKAANSNDRHIAVKLSKETPDGIRFYVVHSPHIETVLADVEFTEPVLLKEV